MLGVCAGVCASLVSGPCGITGLAISEGTDDKAELEGGGAGITIELAVAGAGVVVSASLSAELCSADVSTGVCAPAARALRRVIRRVGRLVKIRWQKSTVATWSVEVRSVQRKGRGVLARPKGKA